MQTRTISDLIFLIKNNNIEDAKNFILTEQNIDYTNLEDDSPLIHAVKRGQKDVVELLLEKGCDIFFQNRKGNNALHAAANFSSRLLHPIEIDFSQFYSPYPTSTSTLKSEEPEKLEEPEASKTYFPNTEILLLILKYLPKDVLANTIRDNKHFLFNEDGDSPLHIAASQHNPEAIKALVEHGFSINYQNSHDGTTSLMSAMKKLFKRNIYVSFETIELLLDLGANLYDKDKNKHSLLHYAISYNLPDVILLFLYRGFNIEIYSRQELLHFAAEASIRSFLGYPPPIPKWKHLVDLEKENNTVIDLLINKFGQDVNQLNAKGSTPLHSAAQDKDFTTCKRLISHGAKFLENREGETPLHKVMQPSTDPNDQFGVKNVGRIDTIKVLLECADCDINKRIEKTQETATDLAVRQGFTKEAELLLKQPSNSQKEFREQLLKKAEDNNHASHLLSFNLLQPTFPFPSQTEVQAQHVMWAPPQPSNYAPMPFFANHMIFPQQNLPVPLPSQAQMQHTISTPQPSSNAPMPFLVHPMYFPQQNLFTPVQPQMPQTHHAPQQRPEL